ncbi:MAG: glucokinase [Acidobacteriota bacterium]|nr:glucokinase [Acidobacteriota bacterium]
MILAGDIGGTKTNLALFDVGDESLHAPRARASYASAKYDSLESILAEFIREHRPDKIVDACLAIAGPVVRDEVRATNLAWTVERASLVRALGASRVSLINDLEATAYGIETLPTESLFALNEGEGKAGGHRALVAAGTGLGMAGIFWDGARYHPMPSEGGHAEFAPRGRTQLALLEYLRRKFGEHVSIERALSGKGLVNIYEFLRDEGHEEEPAWLAREIANVEDAAATISAAALACQSQLATRTLEIFVEIYGATAGNLTLLLKPAGGLYIGGGIAPKILDRLRNGTFMRAYSEMGRMSALANSFPVRVILDDKTALYGAARYAQLRN